MMVTLKYTCFLTSMIPHMIFLRNVNFQVVAFKSLRLKTILPQLLFPTAHWLTSLALCPSFYPKCIFFNQTYKDNCNKLFHPFTSMILHIVQPILNKVLSQYLTFQSMLEQMDWLYLKSRCNLCVYMCMCCWKLNPGPVLAR